MSKEHVSEKNILGASFRNPFFFLFYFQKRLYPTKSQENACKRHSRSSWCNWFAAHRYTHLTSSCFFQFGTKKERMLSLHFLGWGLDLLPAKGKVYLGMEMNQTLQCCTIFILGSEKFWENYHFFLEYLSSCWCET